MVLVLVLAHLQPRINKPWGFVAERLVMPLLIPIRRVVPLVGGIDLSPLVLLILLQIAGIVLGNVQAAVLVAL